MQAESVALFYKAGSSDKIYQAQLKPVTGGWSVTCQYGGRGKSLRSLTKTKHPVDYAEAKKAYDIVVRQKMAKGYTPNGEGEAFVDTANAGRITGYLPQLLNEVTEDEILRLFRQGIELWMQIKHDGERRGVLCSDKVVAANRTGLVVPLKKAIHTACWQLSKYSGIDIEIDTEDMGDHLMIFDLLHYKEDLKPLVFSQRVRPMVELAHNIFAYQLNKHLQIDLPRKAKSERQIKDFIAKAQTRNEEGVVFRMDVAYTSGRPNSNGPCLKVKFWKSVTCRVASQHSTKASIGIEVFSIQNGDMASQWIGIGNCTIPAKYDMPNVGELVEVKYLYAYRGGSLFEPSYKGKRPDLLPVAANINQLKYKK